MTIRTELDLSSPSLPLVNVAGATQSERISCAHTLQVQPGLQMFVVKVDGPESVSPTELSMLDEVVEVTKLGEANGKAALTLTVRLDEFTVEAFEASPDAVLMNSITVTSDGWLETKLFEDYASLTAFQTACENNGISVEVVSIDYDVALSADSSPYGLTERQYEALVLALSRGYYERPRQTTAEVIADELGIS